mgnify:CR=1 FL=1
MQQASTFQVYNASAGSGKTFTLVKEYLKVLLTNDDIFTFQRVLAITFTNKAAAEMKERVLNSLKDFSEGKESVLFEVLIRETNLDRDTLQNRSRKILNVILQNYAAFYITTIDSFTYKIVKSFAFDLGLSQNFEVEMDAQEILNEAVEVLISKIGTEKLLTDVLIDYSLEKADDDKSWDISRDLSEFSRILLNEEDVAHFRKLSNKSVEDFRALQLKLVHHQKEVVKKLKETGEEALNVINTMGLEFGDFYRSMLPNHFLALSKNLEKAKFFEQSALKKRVEENELYAKSKSDDVKAAIEGILPELLRLYQESEELYKQQLKNKLVLKSIIPLAVLNNINQELTRIKEDNNLRLNAEFNQLISDYLQEQPAPYIYERIGQKFMHYFIDEMQDTSVLQWKNLIPLIENSLSQENTSLLLVGDGKQAIYRWRGGKAEQFIELSSDNEDSNNPFFISKSINELGVNYRSYSEVVNFNNSFFNHSSQFIQNPSYKDLFLEKSYQKENENKGGFVSISFLEKLDDKEENLLKYPRKVLQTIQELDAKFSLGDVCVLVRKRSEGVAVANYLSENGIEIVSSETLLLSNSRKVNFNINFLQYLLSPNDKESLFEVLDFLFDHMNISSQKHAFFEEHIHLDIDKLFESFKTFGCDFDLLDFHQLPLYEKIEQIIRSFHLQKIPDAYVQFFLDEVLFQQKKEASVQEFLDYWEIKKNKLSVVSSEKENAVKIMTIHKSKGLEFPIVIFPCDLDIYRELSPKIWLDSNLQGFPELLVPLNKEIQHINKEGKALYDMRREELELDNFNLLYVSLTRAIEQLYIISEKKLSKGIENVNYYSGIFISFLRENQLWNDDQSEYTFGKKFKLSEAREHRRKIDEQSTFISVPWKDHSINLLASSSKYWGTKRGEARNYGDLIHQIMSQIITENDIDKVVENYIHEGRIDPKNKTQVRNLISSIVAHKKLKKYFSKEVTVFNEREIVNDHGQIVIPDRLVFDGKSNITIIDYKTGVQKKEHYHQLENYKNVLKSLNYTVDKKILIYINESIIVEKF